MKEVRWGLLSTARINRRVIPAIRASERGKLVAVASRSAERANTYADEWDIPLRFGTYADMLSSDEIDVVYISTPNKAHESSVIAALDAGKHVLCEKPLATTVDAVDRMFAAAERNGKILAEAFMYRHHVQAKGVKAVIDAGKIGEVLSFYGYFGYPVSPLVDGKPNVRLASDLDGGSLWDVGVYPISFAQYVMGGPPETVRGVQSGDLAGVDMHFSGLMTYSGGRSAHIISSFVSAFHTHVEIHGSLGRIRLTRPFTGVDQPDRAATITYNDDRIEEIEVADEYLYLGEVVDMNSAILDGKSPYLSPAESRGHIETAVALLRSAAENRAVSLTPL